MRDIQRVGKKKKVLRALTKKSGFLPFPLATAVASIHAQEGRGKNRGNYAEKRAFFLARVNCAATTSINSREGEFFGSRLQCLRFPLPPPAAVAATAKVLRLPL